MPSDQLPRRTVLGAEALAALAVPVRLALLNHLLAAGPRTASQCAPVVGETASNCSWHLRALAKVGLVEPAPEVEGDARTRPWQAAAVGFEFAGEGAGANVARRALAGHVRAARRRAVPALSGAAGAAPAGVDEGVGQQRLRARAHARRAGRAGRSRRGARPAVRPHDPQRRPARTARSCRSPCGRSSTPTCSRTIDDRRHAAAGRGAPRRRRPALRGRRLDAVHRAAALRAAAHGLGARDRHGVRAGDGADRRRRTARGRAGRSLRARGG